jgi:hypothetical protein
MEDERGQHFEKIKADNLPAFSLNKTYSRVFIAVQQEIAALASLGDSSLDSGRLFGRPSFAHFTYRNSIAATS